jgi:peptidoglycan/LPS O-acetylase OafA/YrhL
MRHPMLDPFRGLAALWVFGHHLAYLSAGADGPAAPHLVLMGYYGAPMFFVISGYCLTAAARRSIQTRQSPLKFLLRRAARIYPPFWAALLVAVAVYGFGPAHWSRFVTDHWRALTATDWLGIGLLTHGFRPTGELPWEKFGAVNIAFWTLAIEVQFYAVVGLAAAVGRWFYPAVAGLTVVSGAFLFDTTAYVGGWFLPHWPFFALGVGVFALLERNGPPTGTPAAVRVIVAALAAVAMGVGLSAGPTLPDGGPRMVAAEFLFAVGFALVVWLTQAVPAARTLRPFTFLGRISYSVYLLHVPLLMIGMDWAARVAPVGSVVNSLLVVVGVCTVSVPFHYLVERPFLSDRPKRPAGESGNPALADSPAVPITQASRQVLATGARPAG